MLFGFVVNTYGLSWLYTVYPLPWMERGVGQFLGITLLHLILSLLTSIPYAIVSYSSNKRIPTEFLPASFGFLLVCAEVCRSYILSILFYGKGSTFGLHFTAGTIGNALSTTPLIEFAYYGGTYTLTFVLGYLVYTCHTSSRIHMYWKHWISVMGILVCIHFFVPIYGPQEKTTIGILTTHLKLPKNENEVDTYYNVQEKILHPLTLDLSSSSPHFIVYPEDTRYISHLLPHQKTDLLVSLGNTIFIDSDTVTKQGTSSNVSLIYNPKSLTMTARGKSFLMPFSEYMPYLFEPIFLLFIPKTMLAEYKSNHTYAPLHSDMTVMINQRRVGTLLCSEILSFETLEKLKKERPDFVVFQSRLDVFHNNPWFVMQLRSFSKIAAAQMRTTIISSSSNAPSFVISPFGSFELYTTAGTKSMVYTFK